MRPIQDYFEFYILNFEFAFICESAAISYHGGKEVFTE